MFTKFTERIRAMDYDSIYNDTVKETSYELGVLIRNQILSGEDKDGNPLGTYQGDDTERGSFGLEYVKKKIDLGLFPINTLPYYNLFYSGNFLNSITPIVNSSGDIDVISTDSKLAAIEENVEDMSSALTPSEENLNEYIALIKPIIQNKLRGSLGI